MSDDLVGALAQGVADRLWQRIQAQDRLDALEEDAEGPTFRERLAADGAELADAVEDALSAVLVAVADRDRRDALRGLSRDGAAPVTAPVEGLLGAGLAVAAWTGDSASASDAGRAMAGLCDELAARVGEIVGRRLRSDSHDAR